MACQDVAGQIRNAISHERLLTYHQGDDWRIDVGAYLWNALLSQQFYLLLQNLEVTLRNHIYNACVQSSIPLFHLHEVDVRNRYSSKKEFHSSKCWKMLCGVNHTLTQQGGRISEGKIIAELNFGFWVELMLANHPSYQHMWRKIFHEVFPLAPNSLFVDQAIKQVGAHIDNIRKFRNRIFHYEPIVKYDSLLMRQNILEAISWMSFEMAKISEEFVPRYFMKDGQIKVVEKLSFLYEKTGDKKEQK
jgi:hypothetical protein